MPMEPGMMPFDLRPMTSGPVRPTSQYFTSPALTIAPMPTMVAPSYPSVSYGGFQPFTPAPVLDSPFKHESDHRRQYAEQPQLRTDLEESMLNSKSEPIRSPHDFRDNRSPFQRSRSPSVKSEDRSSQRSLSSDRTFTTSMTSVSNVEFNTNVDTLMKAIQAKPDTEVVLRREELMAPGTQVKLERNNFYSQMEEQGDGKRTKERRVFYCDIPGCSKTFYQKTHLDIHRRAHTGDKPYTCKLPGCGHRFSQLGNLKTHERRHTGEKPFHCPQCGKRFAQRGNVRAHLRTHSPTKPFECKLDKCSKNFTQLGNLKSHQNKFHAETLKSLTNRFASIADFNAISKDERELWEYFATLYKNSNKGIKGRGKHRKVGCISQLTPETSPVTPTTAMHTQFPMFSHGLPQLHAPHMGPHPYQGLSHPAAYSMSRPNILTNLNREHQTGYEIFDPENASVGSDPSSSTSGPLYDEDHGRELAFGDRIY